MDYVFVPTTSDLAVIHKSLAFARIVSEKLIFTGAGNLRSLYLFWNRIDGNHVPLINERWDSIFEKYDLNILVPSIPDISILSRQRNFPNDLIFCSTLFPPDVRLMSDGGYDALAKEVISILMLLKKYEILFG